MSIFWIDHFRKWEVIQLITNRFNYADEIKSRVPLVEALSYYGFRLIMGRMPCPFHNGTDRNLSVKRDTFHCWVCGEHGDVITFVMKYFGLSFVDAMQKLNEDFALGLPIRDRSVKPSLQMINEANERQRKAKERKERLEALQTNYRDALDAYAACDVIMTNCWPVSPSTLATADAYSWAARNIDRCWHDLKIAEAELFEFDREEETNEMEE